MEEKQESKKSKKQVIEIEMLKQKCEEYLNGWKRAQADYQNLVKEFEQKRQEYIQFANENLILELLPILDNFKAAFSRIPENEKDSSWVLGFSYIKKQLEDFLRQNGVEEIKTVGEKFDPNMHEAVEEVRVLNDQESHEKQKRQEEPESQAEREGFNQSKDDKENKDNNYYMKNGAGALGEDIIIKEVRPGYVLNKKCVQAAKVIVQIKNQNK